jgi:hypothetical protein
MNAGAKISGLNELRAAFRNIATKVPENARKVMHRSADRIEKEAKINAPVDKHNLEESIHQELLYEERGRLGIDVVAGGVVGGVDVSDYAALIHENYPEDHPGPGTQAKRSQYPDHHVGGHFLDRAIDAEKPKLLKAMIVGFMQDMSEVGTKK